MCVNETGTWSIASGYSYQEPDKIAFASMDICRFDQDYIILFQIPHGSLSKVTVISKTHIFG